MHAYKKSHGRRIKCVVACKSPQIHFVRCIGDRESSRVIVKQGQHEWLRPGFDVKVYGRMDLPLAVNCTYGIGQSPVQRLPRQRLRLAIANVKTAAAALGASLIHV